MELMKLDLHMHTTASCDGFIALEAAVLRAKSVGLDCIAITDHNAVLKNSAVKEMSRKHNFLVIPGSEIKTLSGEIIALDITEQIKPKMSVEETVDRIHEAGGIAIAAHPYSFLLYHSGIGKKITASNLDAVEAFNARTFIGNGITRNLALENNLSMVAGSDAHTLSEIGNAYTEVSADTVEGALKKIKKGKTKMYCKNASFASVFGWYWLKFKRQLSFG